jgi:hypothetical protein
MACQQSGGDKMNDILAAHEARQNAPGLLAKQICDELGIEVCDLIQAIQLAASMPGVCTSDELLGLKPGEYEAVAARVLGVTSKVPNA